MTMMDILLGKESTTWAESSKKLAEKIRKDITNMVRVEHGDKYSCVILENPEAGIWCEISRFDGHNRHEMSDQVYNSICRTLIIVRPR